LSSTLDIIDLIKELGISGIAIYMMFRIDSRLQELTQKISDLCSKIDSVNS